MLWCRMGRVLTGVKATVGAPPLGRQSVGSMACRLHLFEASRAMFPRSGPVKGFGNSS